MTSESFSNLLIDLRGTPCPVNFVRCKLAIEDLSPQDCLQVYLDKGEPEEMVVSGLQREGHIVDIIQNNSSWVKLKVTCAMS